jgi:hypothetical protein
MSNEIEKRRNKYQSGRQGEGSNAYNILNANYEQSQRGIMLKKAE